jgi:hypothetical protein
MNISIKKYFHSTQSSHDTEDATHEFMHPTRDWMLVLGCAVLIFGAGVAFSAYDFYMQFGVPQEIDAVEEKKVRYKDKEVQSGATSYAEKEVRFNALRANKAPLPEKVSETEDMSVQPKTVSTEPTPLAETPVGEYTESAPTLSP